jgi:hypothetical protein
MFGGRSMRFRFHLRRLGRLGYLSQLTGRDALDFVVQEHFQVVRDQSSTWYDFGYYQRMT